MILTRSLTGGDALTRVGIAVIPGGWFAQYRAEELMLE
jgi:hypothetical protein